LELINLTCVMWSVCFIGWGLVGVIIGAGSVINQDILLGVENIRLLTGILVNWGQKWGSKIVFSDPPGRGVLQNRQGDTGGPFIFRPKTLFFRKIDRFRG